MPTMPNLVGLELSEAQGTLQSAGVLNPTAIGYFGTWPITVSWVAPGGLPAFFTADSQIITADSGLPVDDYLLTLIDQPGMIINQSPGAGSTVAQNVAMQLTVVTGPLGTVYP